ncbi:hypothetical protein FQR65_LT13080 [Abscondita terminalis]|nr:hypothetical protein FQR65_LT13080 [Abscondita terminalis]
MPLRLQEAVDIIAIYFECLENATIAARLYALRYPQRRRYVHWSLEYVPPPLDYLANFKINYPSRSNIEDGLCCPDDHILFLSASMSFLQNHLMRKLSDADGAGERDTIRRRTYSNLLLLENNSKCKQTKQYLKLKNMERYNEILQNEASRPSSALTINEILPQPTKSKTIFKLLQKISSNNDRKCFNDKSESTYNLFRNCKVNIRNDSVQTVWTSPVKQLENSTPTTSSINNFEVGLSTMAVNRIAMAANFKKPVEKELKNNKSEIPIVINENVLHLNDKQIHDGDINLTKSDGFRKGTHSKVNILTKSGGKTRLKQVLNDSSVIEFESNIKEDVSSITDVSPNFIEEFAFKISSENL